MMVIITVKEYSTVSFYYPFTFYTTGRWINNTGIILKNYTWEKWCDGNCVVLCWMKWEWEWMRDNFFHNDLELTSSD